MSPRNWRRISQGGFFLLFAWLFIQTEYRGEDVIPYAVNGFLRFDPLVAGAAVIAGRALISLVWPALITVAATLLLGRFFCGWVCPMGSIIDASDAVVARRRGKGGDLSPRWRRVKYLLLVILGASAIFSLQLVFLLDPISLLIRSLAVAVYPALNLVANTFFDLLYRSGIGPVTAVSEPVYGFLKAHLLAFRQPYFSLALPVGIPLRRHPGALSDRPPLLVPVPLPSRGPLRAPLPLVPRSPPGERAGLHRLRKVRPWLPDRGDLRRRHDHRGRRVHRVHGVPRGLSGAGHPLHRDACPGGGGGRPSPPVPPPGRRRRGACGAARGGGRGREAPLAWTHPAPGRPARAGVPRPLHPLRGVHAGLRRQWAPPGLLAGGVRGALLPDPAFPARLLRVSTAPCAARSAPPARSPVSSRSRRRR